MQPPPGVNEGHQWDLGGSGAFHPPLPPLFMPWVVGVSGLTLIYFFFCLNSLKLVKKCVAVALGVWLNGEYGGAGFSWTW